MRKVPADFRRHYRRKGRRSRFWAGLASAVLFAAVLSMAAAGLSVVGLDFRVDGGTEQVTATNATGQIVKVGSNNCTKMDFNNVDGRFSDHRYIPCPDRRSINREYEFPNSRIETFSKGFAR